MDVALTGKEAFAIKRVNQASQFRAKEDMRWDDRINAIQPIWGLKSPSEFKDKVREHATLVGFLTATCSESHELGESDALDRRNPEVFKSLQQIMVMIHGAGTRELVFSKSNVKTMFGLPSLGDGRRVAEVSAL